MKYIRIFYATDLHGSDRCFVKLLNAGKLYEADIIIVGGDVTGKMIIPIIEHEDGSYTTRFLGQDWIMKTQEELEKMWKKSQIQVSTLIVPTKQKLRNLLQIVQRWMNYSNN